MDSGFSQNGFGVGEVLGQRERVVDQDVEPALLDSYPVEQSGDLVVDRVIDLHGDSRAAASGDLCGCLADGARQFVLAGCSSAAGDVHRCTAVTKGHRDAFADTAAGSGDDGDFACQRDHSVVRDRPGA